MTKCRNCGIDVEASGRYWTVCDKCGFNECNHDSPKGSRCKKCKNGFMK